MMKLTPLPQPFTVCQVESLDGVDFTDDYCFLGKTEEEISLVCATDKTPAHTLAREDDWRMFLIDGTLDFGLVGILAKITAILAECSISVFAVSTYNTDYVLTKADRFDEAIEALCANGYSI